MSSMNVGDLHNTALALYQTSTGIFWSALPVAFLLSFLGIYTSGQISGEKFGSLFRRLIIAILLLVAFPEISRAFHDLEASLIDAFGGDTDLIKVFAHVGERSKEIREAGALNWLKVGQIGLSIISVLSFLILAVVRHFLDVLHLMTWNLLHILGPLALLGCLFESWSHVPRGIFTGMLELSLWKPTWVILGRLLLAAGFGETPADPSQWFDTAVLNFSVAALMACTPILVHGFLSGSIASLGGATIQTAISAAGGFLAQAPTRLMTKGATIATSGVKRASTHFVRHLSASRNKAPKPGSPPRLPQPKK
jgi:hypothetical protein